MHFVTILNHIILISDSIHWELSAVRAKARELAQKKKKTEVTHL